jgi:hypothetical protein
MGGEAQRVSQGRFWTVAIIVAIALAVAVNVAVPLLTDEPREGDRTERSLSETEAP